MRDAFGVGAEHAAAGRATPERGRPARAGERHVRAFRLRAASLVVRVCAVTASETAAASNASPASATSRTARCGLI